MKECIDGEKICKRLSRIEGQVRGIVRMIQGDKSCEEILVQIGAAKAALHKTGQAVLEGHLQHCITDAVKVGKEKEAIKNLTSAIELFSRIT